MASQPRVRTDRERIQLRRGTRLGRGNGDLAASRPRSAGRTRRRRRSAADALHRRRGRHTAERNGLLPQVRPATISAAIVARVTKGEQNVSAIRIGAPLLGPGICNSPAMDRWAAALYGDPCRGCSFSFSTELNDSLDYIAAVPEEYSALLEHAVGTERHADLSWPVGSYVCHVADNLRIWAERLAGAAAGAKNVAAYDENVLAEARSYAYVPLVAALWSLRRASGDWQAVVGDVPREGVIIIHPERGDMHLEDVARGAAHDAFHHAWDIRRSVEGAI